MQSSPRIICDTGHNIGGMKYIVEQLKNEKYNQLHFILGVVNDKDVSGILNLLPRSAIYYFVKASIPRALDADTLKQEALGYQLLGESFHSVEEAIVKAKAVSSEGDLIFIGGSNFTVADALVAMSDNVD